jgi:hypothetical protein
MSKMRNTKRTAHQAANDKDMEEEHDFRFLKAPKNLERQAGQLLLTEQDKLVSLAISLRSDTTKNSFKALGLYLSNIDNDFDSYNSNKAETKRANDINEIITINNINYCTPLVRVKSVHYEFCNPLTVSKFPMSNTKRNNKRLAYNSSSTKTRGTLRFKDYQTTNATNSVHAVSCNLKAMTTLQRQLPLSIKECVGRSAYLRIIKSALAVIKHFCLCRVRAHDFILF